VATFSRRDVDLRFDLAVRITSSLWLIGCWLRAGLLTGCWLLLLWAPTSQLAKAVGQLGFGTLAVGLAFAHRSPAALERLARLPGLRVLADHLTTSLDRATANASGLAEGVGAYLMAWVFLGPFPVTGLPVPVRIAGIAFATCYVWDAVLQAMIDPSWYNRRQPPSRPMRVFRWLIPLWLVSVEVIAYGPYSDAAREVPAAVRYALAATPLLYYPVWAAYEVMLRAAAEQVRTAEQQWRADIASDLHSAVKNPLTLLQTHLSGTSPALEESRSLVREARISVEDLRCQLQAPKHPSGGSGTRPFAELWELVARIVPSAARERCRLVAGAGEVQLHDADRLLLQRVLADLLTNAVAHGGHDVRVDLRSRPSTDGEPTLHLQVDDDGPGLPAGSLTDPRSSLRLLRERLRRLGGDLNGNVGPEGGRVIAWWPVHAAGAIAWSAGTGPQALPSPPAGSRR
jgi:signal transduction histidine kinase